MKNIAWVFGLCLLLSGCQQNISPNSEKSVEEIMVSDKISNADLIRNPTSANEPEDTVNIARMVFAEEEYDFGKVVEGEVVTYVFHFTNEGKMPLVITSARSTCGCTVPQWPDRPVAPGESGEINVRFNTAGKKGWQKKPINVTANTYPSVTTVNVVGEVLEKGTTTASNTK